MIKSAWLVNNCLTCIPNTKTFWHDLLEWFPFIEDKTNGYTDFGSLPKYIEKEIKKNGGPDAIIRNATYFRKIKSKIKTISFLQDYIQNDAEQIDVCNSSNIVVYNSQYTAAMYKEIITTPSIIIPIGTNFNLFKHLDNKFDLIEKYSLLPDSILFIGAATEVKGFDLVLNLIKNTNYNFCLVMKDDFSINHPRVKVFNRINQTQLSEIINGCSFLICTSKTETLHLGGIEAAACNLPLLTTNVGAYYNRDDGLWGKVVKNWTFDIKYMFDNLNNFKPREYFINEGFDRDSCFHQWQQLFNNL